MKDIIGKFLLNWRVRKVLPQITGRLLDIGCGTNKLVRAYQGVGIGVDVYDWGNVDIVLEDSSKLPFSTGEFDTVTIIAALNHIPNRKAVLKEAHRVLDANGKIIITMIPPFISTVWHFLRKPWDVDQHERGMKEGEVFGFTKSELQKMLNNCDFKATRIQHFMFGINLLVVAYKSN